MVVTNQTEDFVILGPALARGNKVFEAIHALYFLPENYKLVFAGSIPADQALYNEAVALINRNGLGERVRFVNHAGNPRAVIAPNGVTGDSPEALASAILDVARAAKK